MRPIMNGPRQAAAAGMLAAVAWAALVQAQGATAAAQPAPPGLAVIGGQLHSMAAAPLDRGTVLIANGRIEAVGADLPAPDGYLRIDARRKVVTPGLIDSYSHLGLMEIELEPTANDAALTEYASAPGLDVSYALNPASTLIPINRMDGVTRAISAPLPGVDPLAGLGAVVVLGLDGFLAAPRVALFGHIGAPAAAFTGGSRAAALQRIQRAFAEAARVNPARYRAGLTDYSRHDMAALKAFLRSGRPLALHVDRAADIRRALDLAEAHQLPLVVLGGAEAWQLGDALAEAGAAVVVRVHDNLPADFDSLGARLDNAALLHKAGVSVAFTGSETHNLRNMRQMAGNAVAHGLPWRAALAAMTRAPAEIWGMEDVGVLNPGAHADLVIWSGDPLEVTTWAEQVIIAGRPMPMRSRQTRLFERYRDLSKPYGHR